MAGSPPALRRAPCSCCVAGVGGVAEHAVRARDVLADLGGLLGRHAAARHEEDKGEGHDEQEKDGADQRQPGREHAAALRSPGGLAFPGGGATGWSSAGTLRGPRAARLRGGPVGSTLYTDPPERCGRGGTRTPTSSRTLDPEPSASTNSATRPRPLVGHKGPFLRNPSGDSGGLYQDGGAWANVDRPSYQRCCAGYTMAGRVAETRYIEGQGRYALAEMIGRGGFATVWRARTLSGMARNRDVAVKIIPVYNAGERSRALARGPDRRGPQAQEHRRDPGGHPRRPRGLPRNRVRRRPPARRGGPRLRHRARSWTP